MCIFLRLPLTRLHQHTSDFFCVFLPPFYFYLKHAIDSSIPSLRCAPLSKTSLSVLAFKSSEVTRSNLKLAAEKLVWLSTFVFLM